ncbi:hypothetical protein Hanom_Chr05g00400551 [Helianthus anomalus]
MDIKNKDDVKGSLSLCFWLYLPTVSSSFRCTILHQNSRSIYPGMREIGLIGQLNDLVSIWVHSDGSENGSKQFFPLLSDEVIHWVSEESGENLGVLAGAVIVEAFLLKLCLKFSDGSSKQELRNELRTWAVCSITGFHNCYVFGK